MGFAWCSKNVSSPTTFKKAQSKEWGFFTSVVLVFSIIVSDGMERVELGHSPGTSSVRSPHSYTGIPPWIFSILGFS
ncbi:MULTISPECIES: hypothetical protein [Vibrio]|uniref:hypothetical protein n=1 Tax=Vibrio TaxID=662 RepID=UPI001376AC47|nr:MULTISPECIES: hypothetical protein [Vibrio]MDA0144760.1 hypothetical protein [Vibrio sp. RW]NAZ95833.1 hypothetical protein [Vibrio toranzoniae]